MANPTTYFGWVMPNSADLVTDLPADFNVFGQGVDTSMQYLLGGTTGQILSKTSGTNMAFTWINNDQGDITAVTAGTGISGGGTSGAVTITNSMATEITASGDIIIGTGSGTFDNLPIGTTGQLLTADTTVSPYKVKWATASTTSGPAFAAYRTTNATISTNTWVKIPFNTEYFDLGSCYDAATNYRFTPTTAGIYQFNMTYSTNGNNNGSFYKNGSQYLTVSSGVAGSYYGGSVLISMNGSTDYVEAYVYSTGSTLYGTAVEGGFSGAYIRSN